MKKNVLTILFCLGAILSANTQSNAQTLIDYWNFNVDSTSVLTPTTSLVSGTSLSYAGAYYDTVQPGTILNAVGAYTVLSSGSAALRLRNPAGPFTLALPTTGYKNIVLAYAEERTTNGAQQNIVTYTVNGGTTWKNTAIVATATYAVDSTDTSTNAFQLETFNFSSDDSVNNNPNFMVQINFADGNTNTSGNDRIDNITLSGDTIPGSTGVALISIAKAEYTLYPNPVINSIDINATSAATKSIIITDISGQTIYTGTQTGTHFSISTSTFTAGNYFISINENDGSKPTTMKFIKE